MTRAKNRQQKKLADKARQKKEVTFGHSPDIASDKELTELIQKGIQLHKNGQLTDAATIYQRVLETDSTHADANHLLGVMAHQSGDFLNAVELVSRAVLTLPDQPMYHASLGQAYTALGKLTEAQSSFQNAIAINPDFVAAHSNMGNVLKEMGHLEKAVDSYQKALALNPDLPATWYNLANSQHELGRLSDAVGSYEKAIHLKPASLEAHNNLGLTLQSLGRNSEAAICYQKAIDIQPQFVEAHNNLGNVYREMGHLEDAAAKYRDALAINSNFAEAHDNFGKTLMDMGRMDEALISFRHAIRINPESAESYRHITILKKFTEIDNDVQSMQGLFERLDSRDAGKIHLSFGLGKAFEDMQDYDGAFKYFLAGNRLLKESREGRVGNYETLFKAQMELFGSSLFEKFLSTGHQDETPIFILGMPRSGSTLVEQILASHLDVHGGGELDILAGIHASNMPGNHLWDTNLLEGMGKSYIKSVRSISPTTRFITDKMPRNFLFIGLIKLILPNAKIIHCCRNSMDTCLSIFKSYFAGPGHEYANDLVDLGQYFKLYKTLMEHWKTLFPDFIHDIHYEEIVADPERQIRLLLRQCNLEWDANCLKFYDTSRPVRTASAQQVRQPIYTNSVEGWKRYETQLKPLKDTLKF